jgi:ribosomal protein L3 glutamine methyltransferase
LLRTLGEWLGFAEALYARKSLAVGQVATNPHDEALYLLLRVLRLPLNSGPEALARLLSATERRAVRETLRRRVFERIPAGYLTREAWLGPHRFYVDERVIIPRSYFLEIIPRLGADRRVTGAAADCLHRVGTHRQRVRGRLGEPSLPIDAPLRIADVCTGCGCLAILLARRFPQARIDAIDLSPGALAVAAINVRRHRLGRRIRLWRSDVFDSVPPVRYDLILSNPPYEPSSRLRALPAEFRKEPRMALDGGRDGLAVIRKLLRQAGPRLAPRGCVLVEAGGLRSAIDREFSGLKPRWMRTADGADCICAIAAEGLGG